MEPALLLQTSSVLMALTAVGGLVMAIIRFAGKESNPPSWLAMAHGFLAAAGLTLLAYAWWTTPVGVAAAWALLLFLIAAVGGIVLNLGYHLKSMPLPKGIVIVHAAIAVVAFVLLAVSAWGR